MRRFDKAVLDMLEYSYVTVYKDKDEKICEGLFSTLKKVLDIQALPIKSYYVFEAPDGGIFVDFYT